jgi:hypothetical protein
MSNLSTWNSSTVLERFHPVWRGVLVLLAGVLLLWSGDCVARDVPEIYGRIVKSRGEFEPTRIGINDFTTNTGSPADAKELAALADRIVYNDLDFSYLFEAVRPDTVYLRIMNQTHIDKR